MRNSALMIGYMVDAEARLESGSMPVTTGTYCSYRLRGKAKRWSNRYRNSLEASLERNGWVRCDSVGGSHMSAFRPARVAVA